MIGDTVKILWTPSFKVKGIKRREILRKGFVINVSFTSDNPDFAQYKYYVTESSDGIKDFIDTSYMFSIENCSMILVEKTAKINPEDLLFNGEENAVMTDIRW
jgi:hypothetical protein